MNRPSLQKWRAAISAAFARFPFAILCAAVGAGCGIVASHWHKDDAIVGGCARLAMTVALGMPLFFSLRILREREWRGARYPLELIGIALLAGWFFTHSARPSDEPGIVFFRWIFLLAALHLFAALAPYAWQNEGRGFWQFNRRVFLRFCLATLYTVVLVGGLELALLSADKLFELHLDRAYGDLFLLMVGCFHPTFFLAGVPRDFAALDNDPEYPRGLKAFTQFALSPLVLVYGLILYAYAVKIIFQRDWPHGWVALPVLILSTVGIFACLLLHPLREGPSEKWTARFGRIFPPALAPLSILLLLSLRVRINDYGWTEERYIGVVASLWIFTWSLVFALRRRAGIRWTPASLAVIAVAVAYGPWSAGAVSKRSQLSRLVTMLKKHGLWTGTAARAADTPIELPKNEGTDFRSTVEYLVRMHGMTSVQSLFADVLSHEKWANLEHWNRGSTIMHALHVRVASEETPGTYFRQADLPIDITGFRRTWPMTAIYAVAIDKWNPQKFGDLRLGFDGGVLKIAIGDDATPQPVPLDQFVAQLPNTGAALTEEQSHIDFSNGGRNFRLVVNSVTLWRKTGRVEVKNIHFLLLER